MFRVWDRVDFFFVHGRGVLHSLFFWSGSLLVYIPYHRSSFFVKVFTTGIFWGVLRVIDELDGCMLVGSLG